ATVPCALGWDSTTAPFEAFQPRKTFTPQNSSPYSPVPKRPRKPTKRYSPPQTPRAPTRTPTGPATHTRSCSSELQPESPADTRPRASALAPHPEPVHSSAPE